ncbi:MULTISPECIES: acetyltransferase [unclassified Dysgonomonas]|uniref:acetyltransferase n=1 Tax=unclassified Dysgonomonas TaxID=2630389 RepID=UPI00247622D4|nr:MULTISPECIES: acetyltransferase [unclassified Dysgonomonas]
MYLYGAGGHAKVIIDILKSMNISVTSVYDDNLSISEVLGTPVVHDKVSSPLIISIGNNAIRKKVEEKLQNINYGKALATSAIISDTALIENGTVVMQGVVIQSSVKIGRHAIINTGATVDHDCIIHDFVHIAPGCNLCGNVEVGEGTFIGAGTVIIPGVKVGKWCVVGAGSVIRKNIPDNVMAVGNPCKIYKTINNE